MAAVDLDLRYNQAVVTINQTPHLAFLVDEYVGFQTWRPADRFCLELTLARGVIRTEYDTLEKLKAVIACVLTATEK